LIDTVFVDRENLHGRARPLARGICLRGIDVRSPPGYLASRPAANARRAGDDSIQRPSRLLNGRNRPRRAFSSARSGRATDRGIGPRGDAARSRRPCRRRMSGGGGSPGGFPADRGAWRARLCQLETGRAPGSTCAPAARARRLPRCRNRRAIRSEPAMPRFPADPMHGLPVPNEIVVDEEHAAAKPVDFGTSSSAETWSATFVRGRRPYTRR